MPRHQVIPAVHLFLIRDNQVLLLRRFNTGYEDGNYSVPAGHIDSGEHAVQSMIREAKEEINLDLEESQLEMSHVMNRLNNGEERIDFFFVVNDWQGEPIINEQDKCDQLRWSPIDDLPKNTIPYIQLALENINTNKVYSHLGY